MERSESVRDAMLRFYDRLSAGDVGSFDQLVSGEKATLVIGTAPGEWVRDRDRLRFGFEAEGVGMHPGPAPEGYREGSMGWVVDEPTLSFPDGTTLKTRLTAVLRQEEDAWKIVHFHVSIGVPDEEAADLQKRWTT